MEKIESTARPTLQNAWQTLLLLVPLAVGIFCAFYYADLSIDPTESGSAAISLLNTGVLGNPFEWYTGIATGPTAHVSPVTTVLFAAVYALLGENTHAARICLGLLAALCYWLATILCVRVLRRVGAGPYAVALYFALTCAVPLWLYAAVYQFRQHDEFLTPIVLAPAMLIYLDLDAGAWRKYRGEALMGGLSGLGALIVPSAGLAVAASLGLLIWRRRAVQSWWRAALVSGAILSAVMTPWIVRNYVEFGTLIITRSNFGLELFVGNQPGVDGYYGDNLGEPVHPSRSRAAAIQLKDRGEIAYYAWLKKRAEAYIETHPVRFAKLTARRIWFSFFPTRPMIGHMGHMQFNKIAYPLILLFGALKVAALLYLLIAMSGSRRWFWLIYCMVPTLPYFITHIDIRYEYNTFFPWACLIAVAFERCVAALKARRVLPDPKTEP